MRSRGWSMLRAQQISLLRTVPTRTKTTRTKTDNQDQDGLPTRTKTVYQKTRTKTRTKTVYQTRTKTRTKTVYVPAGSPRAEVVRFLAVWRPLAGSLSRVFGQSARRSFGQRTPPRPTRTKTVYAPPVPMHQDQDGLPDQDQDGLRSGRLAATRRRLPDGLLSASPVEGPGAS